MAAQCVRAEHAAVGHAVMLQAITCKQQLELAMEASDDGTMSECVRAEHAAVGHAVMLQAIACEQQLELAMEASDGGTMCAR